VLFSTRMSTGPFARYMSTLRALNVGVAVFFDISCIHLDFSRLTFCGGSLRSWEWLYLVKPIVSLSACSVDLLMAATFNRSNS
jgi:hypothetical protein